MLIAVAETPLTVTELYPAPAVKVTAIKTTRFADAVPIFPESEIVVEPEPASVALPTETKEGGAGTLPPACMITAGVQNFLPFG
jgi:hypothetical protein